MMIIRVTAEDVSDAQALELKRAIEELVEAIPDVRVDMTLSPPRRSFAARRTPRGE